MVVMHKLLEVDNIIQGCGHLKCLMVLVLLLLKLEGMIARCPIDPAPWANQYILLHGADHQANL